MGSAACMTGLAERTASSAIEPWRVSDLRYVGKAVLLDRALDPAKCECSWPGGECIEPMVVPQPSFFALHPCAKSYGRLDRLSRAVGRMDRSKDSVRGVAGRFRIGAATIPQGRTPGLARLTRRRGTSGAVRSIARMAPSTRRTARDLCSTVIQPDFQSTRIFLAFTMRL